MKKRFALLSAALIVTAYPLGARALGFPAVPPIFPDPCGAAMGCDVTFTDSAALMQAQQYIAMVQNFKNVHNVAGLFGEAAQISALVKIAQAAPPLQVSNQTAAAAAQKAQDDAAKQQWLEGTGAAADGNQQQQQAANGNLASVNSNTSETNLLLSTSTNQKKAQDDDAIATYLEEFGPDSEAAPGSTL